MTHQWLICGPRGYFVGHDRKSDGRVQSAFWSRFPHVAVKFSSRRTAREWMQAHRQHFAACSPRKEHECHALVETEERYICPHCGGTGYEKSEGA